MNKKKFINIAKDVIGLEIKALQKLRVNLKNSFNEAVNAIANCQSKVILCGVGKSGLIASKIAATLASVGTPSFALSASEASHGDRLNDGVPTEARVAAILDAINPLLPTPHKITFDWHFAILITASLKELLILFFNFCRALISRLITLFASDMNFFLFINATRYHL